MGDTMDQFEQKYVSKDDDFDVMYRTQFQDPVGNSALRKATRSNPRNLPCPTCKSPNRLTPRDKARGYQCDACADAEEFGMY